MSGRRELRLSLRTTNQTMARYQVGLVLPDLARFRLINRLLAMRQLDESLAQRLLDQLHVEMVQRLRSLQEQHLEEGHTFCDDMLDLEHQELDAEIDQLVVALRNCDYRSIAPEVAKTLKQQKVQYAEDSREFRYMCIELLKQKITHCEVIKARCVGDFRREQQLLQQQHRPRESLFNGIASAGGPTISDAWAEFYQEKATGLPSPEWSKNTAVGKQATIEEFIAIIGDVSVSMLTRDVILEYRDKVSRLPKNRRKLYPDLSIEQLLELDLSSEQLPASRTIDEKLVAVRSFLTWCRSQKQYIDSDPTDGIKVKAQSRSYAPFTSADLHALFHSEKYKENSHRTSWQYWIPLIGLYTGARLSEIAQLKSTDIVEEDGVWVFNITDAGEGQRVKTQAGIRKVPISSKLINLGITQYARDLMSNETDRLFPDLKEGAKGWGHKVSRWFNGTYKKRCGIENDPGGGRKVFHSFRHTAITKALSAGMQVQHCQQVFGHQKRLMGETETYTHAFPLDSLVPVVESLDYGLDHSVYKFAAM